MIKAEQVEQNYACTSTEVTHNTQNVNLKKLCFTNSEKEVFTIDRRFKLSTDAKLTVGRREFVCHC